MELKQFIKGVLSDVAGAIKESQDEIKNGIVINPGQITNNGGYEGRCFMANNIDFDVAISATTDKEKGIGINVLSSTIGGKKNNETSEVTRIKFSIPVLYPMPQLTKDNEKTSEKPRHSYLDIGGTVTET